MLKNSKKPSYRLIYSIGLIKPKILKIYIKTYLANHFIQLSKSLTNAFIYFILKSDSSFYICFIYQGLNKLTIKNWDFWLLIS